MKLNRTPNPLDRAARNSENDNWDIIEGEVRTIGEKIDDFVEEISDEAFNKIVDSARLDWDKMVDTFGDLPTNAKKGTTIGVKSDSKVYRYDGSNWIDIYEINLNPISEVDDRLSTQLAEETNENPTFRNGKDDLPQLGNELINDATASLGSGWTGNASGGFTHSKGSTDLLELTIPSLKNNTIYNVEINITNPAEVDNGQSDYWIKLGDSNEFETYKGRTNRVVWGIKTVSGNKLVVRPYEDYAGTITLSVKEVLTRIEPYAVYEDAQSGRTSEARYSKDSIGSIYIGKNAGSYVNEFAEQNIVLGNEAGANITSGFWNVLVGHEAGLMTTVGTRNVAVGRRALRENVEGDRNVALGSWALMRNKDGRANVAIGADALYYNVDGDNNIGIGLVAIGQNPSGKNNIGLGERVMSGSEGGEHNFAAGRMALYYVKAGNNVAIGNQSMYQTRNGSDNFASGHQSLMQNRDGSYNIAVGRLALRNADASYNVAVGYFAQRNNLTGIRNIAMGTYAMEDNETGNYNVAIGDNALRVAKGSDNVALGRNAMDNADGGSNLAIGTRALRNFDGMQNIGIGTSSGSREGATGDGNLFIGVASGSNHSAGDKNILLGYDIKKQDANASNELNIGNAIKSKDMTIGIVELKRLQLTNLPTSKPSEAGMVWNDGGTLKVA